MVSQEERNYRDAIHAISSWHRKLPDEAVKLDITKEMLRRVGVSMKDVSRMRCVHVAGTKGKGSTCTLVESILRQCGMRTGTFISPHLIEHRERIRVNGEPISREEFGRYFVECRDKIAALGSAEGTFDDFSPLGFPMLFVMALYCFVRKDVDVAVIEVGIGGRYDATNILENPFVCAITKIDYDHLDKLGRTLESIASHKGGIIKTGRPIVTGVQESCVLDVFRNIASEKSAPFFLATLPDEMEGIEGAIKDRCWKENAVLASHVCKIWLTEYKANSPDPVVVKNLEQLSLVKAFIAGINKANLRGRWQILEKRGINFYLDGAHTPASMRAYVDWANQQRDHSERERNILIFNVTGTRDGTVLMALLQLLQWDLVLFTPNTVDPLGSPPTTNYEIGYLVCDKYLALEWAKQNELIWAQVLAEREDKSAGDQVAAPNTVALSCVREALQYAFAVADSRKDFCKTRVFITGSIALVGCSLACLESM